MVGFLRLPPEQKEKTRHGESMFPLQKYVTILDQKSPVVTAHWHEEAEFTYIAKGFCTCQVQLTSYDAAQGDFIFVPPAVLHSITSHPVSFKKEPNQENRPEHTDAFPHPDIFMELETYVFHMNFLGNSTADVCSVRYLAPIAGQKIIPPSVIRKGSKLHQEIFPLFMELNSAYKDAAPGYELVLKSRLLYLIALLLPYCQEAKKEPNSSQEHIAKLKTVLEHIEGHFSEDLTVASLAGMCYFSEYYFMRFFKKYVGMSCLDYIKNYRLNQAARMLEQKDASILDISIACGFHNLSYFYREFKKKYGMTPKDFVKSNEKEQSGQAHFNSPSPHS